MGAETKYVTTVDGFHIAYQVFGSGSVDLVAVPGSISHLEVYLEQPLVLRFVERLASFARVICFDKRGTGLSDPVPGDHPPTLEERMEDLRAVLDAVGSERAAVLGFWEANAMSALFAATFPERVSALILYGPFARLESSDDYPWAPTYETGPALRASIETGTHADLLLSRLAPSLYHDGAFRAWFEKLVRLSASPGQYLDIRRMNAEIDMRVMLPSIRVPTLVLHRQDDALVPPESGRWVASQIPGAEFVLLPGRDYLPFVGDMDSVIGEIEEFVTGHRHPPPHDRLLATVLFVDIVGSTERAAEVGDARWVRLLDEFERLVARQLDRFQGRLVKTTGDGVLATFDGPARAVRCASAVQQAADSLGLQVRAGLHTGEVELRAGDLGGIAVHIGRRISDLAGPSEVWVSGTVRDLVVGSEIEFEDRGELQLKGVPGRWRLLAVR